MIYEVTPLNTEATLNKGGRMIIYAECVSKDGGV